MRWLGIIGMMGGAAAEAQMVADCEGSALQRLMPELSEGAYREFANGAIRVFDVYVDSNLPSSVIVGVLHPRKSDLAGGGIYQACSAIYSARPEPGYFGQVFLRRAQAEYDPSSGLTLNIPVRYDYATRAPESGTLTLMIDQSNGTIEATEE